MVRCPEPRRIDWVEADIRAVGNVEHAVELFVRVDVRKIEAYPFALVWRGVAVGLSRIGRQSSIRTCTHSRGLGTVESASPLQQRVVRLEQLPAAGDRNHGLALVA